jgi:cell wall-associated NlpC family hydrolase
MSPSATSKCLSNPGGWFLSGLVLLLLLNGCASTQPPPDASATVDYALRLQGTPYRYGGEEPESGFDCSGFVQHVYARHGVKLPRTSREMAERLPKIPLEQCEIGDLLFFHVAGKPFSHVGLYLGEERFIHAPSTRSGSVKISSLKQSYWRKRLAGARRPPPLAGQ